MVNRVSFSEFNIGEFKMSGNTAITANMIGNYETNLWKALQEFNLDYFIYIGNCHPCPPDKVISNGDVTTCNNFCFNQGSESKTCSDAKSLLEEETKHLTTYIEFGVKNYEEIFRQYGNLQSVSDFNNIRGNIIGNVYPSLLATRSDLDKKLRDLYEIDGSISLDQQNRFDGTIYSGILITVLASALVYYTFTKL